MASNFAKMQFLWLQTLLKCSFSGRSGGQLAQKYYLCDNEKLEKWQK